MAAEACFNVQRSSIQVEVLFALILGQGVMSIQSKYASIASHGGPDEVR